MFGMLDVAIANLKLRKVRFLFTLLGIAAPVMLYVMLGGIITFMSQDVDADFVRLEGLVQVRPPMTGAAPRTLASSFATLTADEVKGILSAAGKYDPTRTSPIVYVELEPAIYPNGPAQMSLVGVEPGREDVVVKGIKMQAGEARLGQPGDAIIGRALAEKRGLKVGDPIQVGQLTYYVRGVLHSGVGNLGGQVLVSLADAQAFTKRGDSVSAVWVGYQNVNDVAAGQQAIQAAYPNLEALTKGDLTGAFDAAMVEQRYFFDLMQNSGLVTAAIVVFLVMYTAVMERTREIGTLRALGAPRWQVVSTLLQEALILAVAGAVLGSLVSIPFQIRNSIEEFRGQVWGHAFPSMLKAVATTVAISLLAAAYPSWRAARLNPIESLRHE